MAGRIRDDFIDDLLARVDVVDVIGRYVPLKRAGKNYQACCPFHQEKTPSFTVSPEKQFYYCFGCGKSGNAVGFVMDHQRLPFPEAVESLARSVGIEVPREGGDAPKGPDRRPLYDMLERAARQYREQLNEPRLRERPLAYLRKRGLSRDIIERFGVGYAPPGWDHLMKALGQDEAGQRLLEETGLVVTSDQGRRYDRFRDRVMFPIRDGKGRTVAFGGRVLGDEKPKYLNSPETAIFHKGETLYGFWEARQQASTLERFIVVEGYMDVIALAQAGIHCAVATLGTACTREHVDLLFRHVTEVVFCFDGDRAGRAAAWRALENTLPVLREGRTVRFHFLPDGEDPDTLVRKQGPEVFMAGIGRAKPLPEYLLDHLAAQSDLATLDGRARLAQSALPLIAQIPAVLLREVMTTRLSELTRLEREHLERVGAQPPRTSPARAETATPPASRMPSAPAPAEPPPWVTESDPPSGPADYRGDRESYRGGQGKPRGGSNPYRSDDRGPESRYRPRSPAPRPAAPAPVISLVDTAIRSLLHAPAQARDATIPAPVRSLDIPHLGLLCELIDYLTAHPDTSMAALLGHWHATEEGEHLASLAAREFLLPAEQMHNEVAAALNRLHLLRVEQELAALSTSRSPDPSRLRALLQLKQDLSRPKA